MLGQQFRNRRNLFDRDQLGTLGMKWRGQQMHTGFVTLDVARE